MPDDSFSPKEISHSGRSRILAQAEQLFRTRGYNAVTMRDIAGEVGIRQASLYYHFPSKEQLFVAVTERMFERHRTGLQQAIDDAGDELRSQLHAVGGWFLSQPPIHFLSLFHNDMPSLGEDNIKKLAICSEQCIFEPLRQTFIKAQQRGEIRHTRPESLAGFFLSVMESIPFVITGSDAVSGEIIVDEMISVLLDGLKP
ncbi:TetR/AcrR family transcriptional regulator [Brasilonema bromeliae]|uniref:TetR/AcrR family transcriptional regulator n=1 Tax=Brasilonema bromeliae SPC951 TaxID=385972 RepID=A0ABX1P9N1_9CYAN|nr:TetR/AcrR family transcriptional regulator [Brasilonema bromeliae]NMG21085.1 TetR/AcrR family transcriptional regulator [Brasilonema bromeliae SPC951]